MHKLDTPLIGPQNCIHTIQLQCCMLRTCSATSHIMFLDSSHFCLLWAQTKANSFQALSPHICFPVFFLSHNHHEWTLICFLSIRVRFVDSCFLNSQLPLPQLLCKAIYYCVSFPLILGLKPKIVFSKAGLEATRDPLLKFNGGCKRNSPPPLHMCHEWMDMMAYVNGTSYLRSRSCKIAELQCLGLQCAHTKFSNIVT